MADMRPQVRVFCWSNPRSLSTALMKCISTMPDSTAWLEPYGTAEHFGPEGRLRPLEEIPPEPQYTPEWVKVELDRAFEGRSLVFVKDMAYSILERFQFLPKGYRHSFLIRHPQKAFMSYYKLLRIVFGEKAEANFRSWLPKKGFGYGEMVELADYVEKELGEPLVIIDADDLLLDPEMILKKYCSALGLPFTESLLSWDLGIPNNWIVAESILAIEADYHWMGTVLASRGFHQKGHSQPMNAEEVPPVVREMTEVALPFYDRLHAKRILPS